MRRRALTMAGVRGAAIERASGRDPGSRRTCTGWSAVLWCVWAAATGCVGGSPGPSGSTPRDTLAAKVPSLDGPTTLDAGTWNLEWFGDAGNGPTNEALQLETVRAALTGMSLDIVGVQEVVSQSQWEQLEQALPGYAGLLAGEPTVNGGPGAYSAGEQKVGILYRSSVAKPVETRIVLAPFDNDFAGRPPLEVSFRITLDGVSQDLVVLVIHMKAFPDADSWQRRVRASAALKGWIDATWPTQKVMVLGDWNDDLDQSIAAGRPSPYANFLDDAGRYAFPTIALSLARIATTDGFPDAVDHHLVTNELAPLAVVGSVRAVRLDQYIANYSQITSDHFPVVVSYRMR